MQNLEPGRQGAQGAVSIIVHCCLRNKRYLRASATRHGATTALPCPGGARGCSHAGRHLRRAARVSPSRTSGGRARWLCSRQVYQQSAHDTPASQCTCTCACTSSTYGYSIVSRRCIIRTFQTLAFITGTWKRARSQFTRTQQVRRPNAGWRTCRCPAGETSSSATAKRTSESSSERLHAWTGRLASTACGTIHTSVVRPHAALCNDHRHAVSPLGLQIRSETLTCLSYHK